MRGPNFSVHEFKCPDCGLSCQLIQDGRRASMRHQLPKCKTYEATKADGQKFLELAFIAVAPDKPDPVLVAFRDSGQQLEPDSAEPEELAPLAAAAPNPQPERCTCLAYEGRHAANCPSSPYFMRPRPETERRADPPRWQPLLEQLASELRAQIYDRGEVSKRLAQALIEANPGDSLVGFDDSRIAGIAQAIAALCGASKGHP